MWLGRRSLTAVFLLFGSLLTGSPGHASSSFTSQLVRSPVPMGGPVIRADRSSIPHRLYLSSAGAGQYGGTQVWASSDRGVSFQPAFTSLGKGASDLAVDGSGNVYVVDQADDAGNSRLVVSVSEDRGASVSRSVDLAPAASGIRYSRPWIGATGQGRVIVNALEGGAMMAWSSSDGARSFSGPVRMNAREVEVTGAITAGPDGSWYQPFADQYGLWTARSPDGRNWWGVNAYNLYGLSVVGAPALAVHGDGIVTVAWAQSASYLSGGLGAVWLTKSPDGIHFGNAIIVSEGLRNGYQALLPSLTVGSSGSIDVSYIQAASVAGAPYVPPYPELAGGPATRWDLKLAQWLPGSLWTNTTVQTGIHLGSACTPRADQLVLLNGTLCYGPQSLGYANAPTPLDPRLGETFGSTVDDLGRLHIPYVADRAPSVDDPTTLLNSWTDLYVGVQTGGSTLS